MDKGNTTKIYKHEVAEIEICVFADIILSADTKEDLEDNLKVRSKELLNFELEFNIII